MAAPDVAVVGGGVIGASIAYHLARRGARVTLVDPGSPRPPSASWASAGGVRSQDRDAAEWLLTVAAAARWPLLEAELDADLGFRRGGHLHVALDAAVASTFGARVVAERAAGIAVAFVDGETARAIAPGLSSEVHAATWTPDDGQADPRATTTALLRAAARAGATVRQEAAQALLADGGAIAGVTTSTGTVRARHTVIATGSWTGRVVERHLDLPLRVVSLQMLLTAPRHHSLDATVSAQGLAVSIKQRPDGAHFLGGGWPGHIDEVAHTAAVDDASVRGGAEAAARLLPALAGIAISDSWCGLESLSTDGVPLIGPSGLAGLYLAVGFSGHGFQLAPAVGEAVADDILERRGTMLEALRPARFADLMDGRRRLTGDLDVVPTAG